MDRPSMRPEQREALLLFAETLRKHYGQRLGDVVVFGSRARGDHREDSDVDVAVVLADDGFDFWVEKLKLIDLSHEAFFDHDLMIQAWPIAKSVWSDPALHTSPGFVREARRDARPIGEAA